MTWWQLRPTFQLEIAISRAEAISRLNETVRSIEEHRRYRMHGEYGELHLPSSEHRFWSPHLSFFLHQPDAEQACRLHGRFAPRFEIWTMVWAVYLAMSFTAFYGLTLAYSQWMLGETAWGLWVAIIALAIVAGLYIVAAVGQRWSLDQMDQLRNELEQLLRQARVDFVAIAPANMLSAEATKSMTG